MAGSEALLTVTAPDRGWESWGCAPDQLPEALSAGPPIAGPLCHLLPTPRFQDSHGVGAPRAPGQEGAEGVHTHCLSMTPWGPMQV